MSFPDIRADISESRIIPVAIQSDLGLNNPIYLFIAGVRDSLLGLLISQVCRVNLKSLANLLISSTQNSLIIGLDHHNRHS